jgi:hypothetical protein
MRLLMACCVGAATARKNLKIISRRHYNSNLSRWLKRCGRSRIRADARTIALRVLTSNRETNLSWM